MSTVVYVIIALTCAVAAICFVTLVVVLRNLSESKQKSVPLMASVSSDENTSATRDEAASSAVENTEPRGEESNLTQSEQSVESTQIAFEDDEKIDADVAFSTDKLTLEQKYLKLPPKKRAYYDEIVRYAMAVDGHKRFKSSVYEEYKVGKSRLVRIKIKNDVITCELIVPNLDFKNYINDNKIDVRQTATVIRVDDEASLEAVKGCMDVALQEIEKERRYKKEQALERRRQRRAEAKAQKETNNDATDSSTNEISD